MSRRQRKALRYGNAAPAYGYGGYGYGASPVVPLVILAVGGFLLWKLFQKKTVTGGVCTTCNVNPCVCTNNEMIEEGTLTYRGKPSF
jgi:hypothetical protein